MSKCILKNYKCRGCTIKETCNVEKVTIDSSILLSIIKHEDTYLLCEERLNQIKKDGKGFVNHIILAEVYEETINFIEKETKKLEEEFNMPHLSVPWKLKKILEIIDVLKNILEDLDVVEIDKEAGHYSNKLFSLPRVDMKNRDIINLGTAESHLHNKFLFIDEGINSAKKSILDLGFKIELEPIKIN